MRHTLTALPSHCGGSLGEHTIPAKSKLNWGPSPVPPPSGWTAPPVPPQPLHINRAKTLLLERIEVPIVARNVQRAVVADGGSPGDVHRGGDSAGRELPYLLAVDVERIDEAVVAVDVEGVVAVGDRSRVDLARGAADRRGPQVVSVSGVHRVQAPVVQDGEDGVTDLAGRRAAEELEPVGTDLLLPQYVALGVDRVAHSTRIESIHGSIGGDVRRRQDGIGATGGGNAPDGLAGQWIQLEPAMAAAEVDLAVARFGDPAVHFAGAGVGIALPKLHAIGGESIGGAVVG